MSTLPSASNKGKYVQDTFNSIAGSYDLMNKLMSMGFDKAWRRKTVRFSELGIGGKGLDICCGTGMLTMEQAQAAGLTGENIGLDFSENMLAVAEQNVAQFELRDNITFIQGNAMDLPFEDSKFDCATVGWGLRNVPDIFTTVNEMVRVVKPGGKVVSLDMAKPMLPLFKQIYWLCFQWIVPTIGKLFSGNKKAYDYLHDSSKAFINQVELANMFREAGLVEVRYHNLFGGAVAIVEGRKPVTPLKGENINAWHN